MRRHVVVFAVLLCGLLGVGIGSLSCVASEVPSPTPEPANAVYLVELTTTTPAGLPEPCTSGTVAFVSSPPGLWTCANNLWTQISCTVSKSGSVAYASATQTLFACLNKQWTRIALPAGPPGPPGPRGPQGDAGAQSLVKLTQEPPGHNCADGGERIDVGIDRDGDGVLQPSEITQTAYVCNGLVGGNADATTASDAADAFDGFDGGPNVFQQFSAQYAQAFCFGQGKCCAGFDAGAFDLAACAATNTLKGWRSTLPANASAYTAGHLALNGEAGAGCISALRAFPCGTIAPPQFAAILNACNGVLTGNIANGSGPCVSSFECANGYCASPVDGAAGTCAPLVGQGAACKPGNDSPDHMCTRAGVAQPRLWCDVTNHPDGGGATCVPPLPNGAGCFNSATSYWDDYGCVSLLCGDSLTCGSNTAAYPDPGWCSAYAPSDAGGG
jgi:hypothetical protein